MVVRRCVLVIAALGLVTGCSGPSGSSGADGAVSILALGDSIFEYNSIRGDSIPDVIGNVLDTRVVNASRAGAHFSNPDPAASAEGLDVRGQLVDGNWQWIVVEGGGNDYLEDCGCGDCGSQIDQLVADDGLTGEIPDFVRVLVSGDTQVMLVGYYDVPPDAQFGFDRCADEVQEHNRRLMLLAEAVERAWYVSAGDVVSVDDRAAFAQDRVHPSLIGSKAIGEYIAEEIMRIEGN